MVVRRKLAIERAPFKELAHLEQGQMEVERRLQA
jgi:hypothetical protein